MGRKGWFTYLILSLMFFVHLGTAPLWAGDGTGGGQGQPLAVVTSLPASGATEVSNLDSITVIFSKNVVYMTVRENNQKCFTLWQGQEAVPVEIIMADDQVEFDKRNDVVIKPYQPLQPGCSYRLEIASELESKSGVTLGEKTTISFTTAGVANDIKPGEQESAAVPPSPPESAQSDITEVALLPVSGDEAVDAGEPNNPEQSAAMKTNKLALDNSAENRNEVGNNSRLSPFSALIIAGALIILGIGLGAYRRKNRQ
jgi:hypothetical protein